MTKSQESWEDKYYKEFGQFNQLILYTGHADGTVTNEPVQEKIHDFIEEVISQEHTQLLEQVRGMIEKMKIKAVEAKQGRIEDQIDELNAKLRYRDGFNQAIDDLLSELSKLEKEL